MSAESPFALPIQLGSRVRVSRDSKYADDWPGVYVVTELRWDYQRGDGRGINVAIASDDEIRDRNGSTDGWAVDELIPEPPASAQP